jgi:hypothetical protein
MLASAMIVALVLPQLGRPLAIDGELDEIAWRSPARTGAFVDPAGAQAAPYSDARFLRDDHDLYLALYAADEDIRSSDEFVVEMSSARGHATWHFSAAGKVVPAPGVRVAIDRDGSLDDPSNDDEEWVVEAAIPLAAIPFGRDGKVRVTISRCDRTKDGVTRCGSWRGALATTR